MATDREIPRAVWHAVLWHSLLWTLGNALTTGGFVNYFVQELGVSTFLLGLILAAPELASIAGLCTREVIGLGRRRKQVWLTTTVISRLAMLAIPVIAMLAIGHRSPIWGWNLLGVLLLANGVQGIAQVAYLAWMADLAPPARWGRFFFAQSAVSIGIRLMVPPLAAWWRHANDKSSQSLQTYFVIFLVGTILLVLSVIPMLNVPDAETNEQSRRRSWNMVLAEIWRDPNQRWLLAYSWCLGLGNGLTQAIIARFMFQSLQLPLVWYTSLNSVMLVAQLGTGWYAAQAPGRFGHKHPLFWGTLISTFSMPLLCLAGPQQWWPAVAAFVCWGAFGAVNLAGPNLVFSLSPRGDVALQTALFRNGAGMLAGLAGIAGGACWYLLFEQQTTVMSLSFDSPWGSWEFSPFQGMFLMSFAVRLTAVLLLLPVRDVSGEIAAATGEGLPAIEKPGP